MIKGTIFDLDGTLLNTIEDINDSLNETLESFGYKAIKINETKARVGRGFRNLVKDCLPEDVDEKVIEEISLKYKDNYFKNCMNKTTPYDGILDLLHNLQEKHIKIGINSNKSEKSAKNLAFKYFPGIIFTEIICRRNAFPLKPEPFGANEIIKKMNLKKEEVLYIGDSETDVQTAHNLGVKSVGCLWGFRDRKTLEKEGCDFFVSKPDEILELIKQ